MADVTINLIHQEKGLYYKTDKMESYELMGIETTVAADPGQSIAWVCGDDSISSIVAIEVNVKKPFDKNWSDFYIQKPDKIDPEGKCWEGLILSDPVDPKNPEFNGYDITYLPTDATEPITVDPDITIPAG